MFQKFFNGVIFVAIAYTSILYIRELTSARDAFNGIMKKLDKTPDDFKKIIDELRKARKILD